MKYLAAVIFLVVPLYPKFPLIRVPGTYVSIRLEDFVMVLALIILIKFLIVNFRKVIAEKTAQAIVLYLAVGLISFLSGIFVTKTIFPYLGFLHWARRVEYFVPFFVGLYAMGRKSNLEFYLKLIMLTIFIVFLYGLGQRFLNLPIIVTQNLEYSQGIALRYVTGSHINSSFAGHYDLGTYLVFFLPVFICMFFLLKDIKTKIIIFTVACGGLWLLSFSGSRISAFSYLAAITVALIIIKKYKALILVFLFSFVFFSMSQNLTSRYLRIFEVAGEKLIGYVNNNTYVVGVAFAQEPTSLFPEKRTVAKPTPTPTPIFEDRSTSIRLQVEWPRALRAFAKNPLLGTGMSSITLATDNDFLRIFGELGILGFLSFALIFLRFAKLLKRTFPLIKHFSGLELAFLAGIVGGNIGILINATFLDIFEASKFAITYWLVMGIAVSLVSNLRNGKYITTSK